MRHGFGIMTLSMFRLVPHEPRSHYFLSVTGHNSHFTKISVYIEFFFYIRQPATSRHLTLSYCQDLCLLFLSPLCHVCHHESAGTSVTSRAQQIIYLIKLHPVEP